MRIGRRRPLGPQNYGPEAHRRAYELYRQLGSFYAVAKEPGMPSHVTLLKWAGSEFKCAGNCPWHNWHKLNEEIQARVNERARASVTETGGEVVKGLQGGNSTEKTTAIALPGVEIPRSSGPSAGQGLQEPERQELLARDLEKFIVDDLNQLRYNTLIHHRAIRLIKEMDDVDQALKAQAKKDGKEPLAAGYSPQQKGAILAGVQSILRGCWAEQRVIQDVPGGGGLDGDSIAEALKRLAEIEDDIRRREKAMT